MLSGPDGVTARGEGPEMDYIMPFGKVAAASDMNLVVVTIGLSISVDVIAVHCFRN